MNFNTFNIFIFLWSISDAVPMGTYKVVMESLEVCSPGSRPQKYSTTAFGLDGDILFTNMSILEDMGPIMAKTRLFTFKEGKFLPTLSLDQDNLCKLPFPLKAMKLTFDVDFKTCTLKKGVYVNNITMTDTTQELMGKKFFYARFKMISEWYTKKYRIFCNIAIGELKPE